MTIAVLEPRTLLPARAQLRFLLLADLGRGLEDLAHRCTIDFDVARSRLDASWK